MHIYLRYNTWWIRYMRRGRLVRKSLRTHDRTVAEGVLASMRVAVGGLVSRGVVDAMLDEIYETERRRDAGIPLSRAWEVYSDVARSAGLDRVGADTLRKRRGRLAAFCSWIREQRPGVATAEDVDGPVAAAYASHLRDVRKPDGKPLSDKTRQLAIDDLSTVWTVLGKASARVANPWTGLRPRVLDQKSFLPFTREEEDRVLEAARRAGHDWHPVCALGRHTSFRYGDCATLRRDEVDLEAGVIVRAPRKLGGRVVQRVPIETGTLLPALRDAMARRPREDDLGVYLFPEHAYYYLHGEKSHAKMPVQFRDVMELARVTPERHTFHSWRHTFRTRLGEAEVPIETAMDLCGHLTREMSRRYDHADHMDAKRAAVEAAAK